MEDFENIITGVVSSHPIPIFREVTDFNTLVMGFTFKVQTTELVNYQYQTTEVWVTTIYDVHKWDIIRKGQKLELSIQNKQKSSYSDDGVSLKCNVVSRTTPPKKEDMVSRLDELFNTLNNTI